ncbi:MAG TPA: SRPBCC family protein [Fimbriimonas sp.]
MDTEIQKKQEIDASDIEHVGAMVTGGMLLLSGLRRGGPLGFLLKIAGVGLIYRGQQGYKKLYDAIGIDLPKEPTGVGPRNVRVESSVVVEQPRAELYRLWRNLENLPAFMSHLESVEVENDQRSIWTAKAPAGTIVRWEAEIVNDIENELIAWQTLEGSGVDNAGSVHFEDAGEGNTRIRVVLRYNPPGDMLGVWIARIFHNDPQRQIDDDLRRFKRIMELGNTPAIDRTTPGAEMI